MSAAEAEALIEKAEKKLNSFGWFGGNKFEEAGELYTKAGNSFKLAKKWKEAGDAFIKAADMYNRLNEREEASSRYIDASKCYKKSNPQDAINALKEAISILTERGRFHAAATHQKTIAEIYESDVVDLENALLSYEQAAEWFAGEEAGALANGALLKVATFAAQLEQYDKAIEVFEKIAAGSVDNQLAKWSLKDYFLKAGLCHMAAGDYVGARRAVEKYCDMDVTFNSTRECQFLKNLLDALEAADVDAFTGHVVEFDKLTKLDNWKTTILLRIKKGIESQSFT